MCLRVAFRVVYGLLEHVPPICGHIVSGNLFVWKHTSVVPALVLSMCRIAVLLSNNSANAGHRFRSRYCARRRCLTPVLLLVRKDVAREQNASTRSVWARNRAPSWERAIDRIPHGAYSCLASLKLLTELLPKRSFSLL